MKHRKLPPTALPLGICAFGLAGALFLSGMSFADETAPATIAAVWQKHQYTFQFLGFTSTYSCDGLADQLKVLLKAAGARADVKSQPGACAASFGRPDKFARADLTFYTLAPQDANAATGGGKPVNGIWKSVTFSNHTPRELAIGDCELIEQFRSQVLPMFTTRNVVNNTTCIPHQDSGSTVDLRFDSLTAPPVKKGVAAANGSS